MCKSEAAHVHDPEIAWISFKKKRNCLDHKFITSVVMPLPVATEKKKDFVGLTRRIVQQ